MHDSPILLQVKACKFYHQLHLQQKQALGIHYLACLLFTILGSDETESYLL